MRKKICKKLRISDLLSDAEGKSEKKTEKKQKKILKKGDAKVLCEVPNPSQIPKWNSTRSLVFFGFYWISNVF